MAHASSVVSPGDGIKSVRSEDLNTECLGRLDSFDSVFALQSGDRRLKLSSLQINPATACNNSPRSSCASIGLSHAVCDKELEAISSLLDLSCSQISPRLDQSPSTFLSTSLGKLPSSETPRSYYGASIQELQKNLSLTQVVCPKCNGSGGRAGIFGAACATPMVNLDVSSSLIRTGSRTVLGILTSVVGLSTPSSAKRSPSKPSNQSPSNINGEKGSCPTCKGAGWGPFSGWFTCWECSGKGGWGAFGPCDIQSVHFRRMCQECKGLCYSPTSSNQNVGRTLLPPSGKTKPRSRSFTAYRDHSPSLVPSLHQTCLH